MTPSVCNLVEINHEKCEPTLTLIYVGGGGVGCLGRIILLVAWYGQVNSTLLKQSVTYNHYLASTVPTSS